jgi:hypothetical protein
MISIWLHSTLEASVIAGKPADGRIEPQHRSRLAVQIIHGRGHVGADRRRS